MREIVMEAVRKRGIFFKAFTVIIVLFVFSTQLFVVFNMQQKYSKNNEAVHAMPKKGTFHAKKLLATTPKPTTTAGPGSISQVLKRLSPPKLDEFQFESDVLRPQQDMLAKFPAHPSMVINKLAKVIEKEERKSSALVQEIEKVRDTFGLSRPASTTEPPPPPPSAAAGTRRLSSVSYEPGLPACPQQSPHLLGPLVVKNRLTEAEEKMEALGSEEWSMWYGSVKEGGSYQPEDCQPSQKVAIIVPYRNRAEHLRLFLRHMHPILQRQQLNYRIFIIEQAGDEAFNRAALMNVGYKEASKKGAFDCFVFHDVDLVPEDDRNIYSCPKDRPKHLAVAVNKWKYRLIYNNYFGGVTALSKEQFENVNGFSNSFYGWGGEDDDLFHRVEKKGYGVFRYPGNIGRYSMLKHGKVDMNENLDSMMEKSKKDLLTDDGLTTLHYKKLNERLSPLHTWILVKLPPAPPKRQRTAWDTVKSSLWSGMEKVGGGIALSVSDHANQLAIRKESEREKVVDRVY